MCIRDSTMVLIDGVIVNSPTTGAYDFANLTTENIDRIEIIRGAQSMLYGSDAIGGVINIYTKRGTDKISSSAFVEYGSFASIREGVQASGSKGPVDISASLSRWDTSSFPRSIIDAEHTSETVSITGKLLESSASHCQRM